MKMFVRLLGGAALMSICVSAPVFAAEGGMGAWLKGYGSFMAGVVPPEPGF